MAEEEGFLSKADKFLRKWSGGDYYERKRKGAVDAFERAAPKTSKVVKKAADALATGAEYSPIGGGMVGMVKKAKTFQSGTMAGRVGQLKKGPEGPTKMKTRSGLEKKVEPKVVDSGRSKALEKTRQGDTGPTKQKDRRGLEIKAAPKKTFGNTSSGPKDKGMARKAAAAGVATGAIVGGYYGSKALREAKSGVAKDKPKSNDFDKAYRSLNSNSGVQAPNRALNRSVPARVKAKPDDLKKPYEKKKAKPERKGKSKTRIAFEKAFAKARREGKKEFTFNGGKYKSYNTKLAK